MTSPFREYSELVEKALERLLPAESLPPAQLHRAMRYTSLGGGKRLRGMLVLAGAEAIGGDREQVLPAAAAVELVHAYSLIHDDLPCMDDDDLRRGKPANHVVFGEAVALLAGDALLAEAFKILADLDRVYPSERVLAAIKSLARACSSQGMVGGQAEDLANTGDLTLAELDWINDRKTGVLIVTSLVIGAQLAGGGGAELAALSTYGTKAGRAFQIIDDILDEVGDPEVTGKPSGSDRASGKRTYPGLLGIEGARAKAAQLIEEAKAALAELPGETGFLVDLADYILARDR
ncbi:MAG: polyprenyl synthetase family protein [Firmicutes bacterium]|nr:polyprenyl synthetase family protein [Bacillota bacterium]